MTPILKAVIKISRLLGQSQYNHDANDAGGLQAHKSTSYLGVLEPSNGPRKKFEEALHEKTRKKPWRKSDPAVTYEET